MGTTAYHHGEIVEALCLLCRGAVALIADASGSAVVQVGSNRLFAVGEQVAIRDGAGSYETRTVVAVSGLHELTLDAPLTGHYAVSEGAHVALVGERVPSLKWVGRGRPVHALRPHASNYPCVVVDPIRLEQPLKDGTNRSYLQDYLTAVYWVGLAEGDGAGAGVAEEAGRLFDLLMADPYLGGCCWYGQVVSVDCRPPEEAELQQSGVQANVIRYDVLARRTEYGRG